MAYFDDGGLYRRRYHNIGLYRRRCTCARTLNPPSPSSPTADWTQLGRPHLCTVYILGGTFMQQKNGWKKIRKIFWFFFCEIIFSKGNLFLNVLLHFETILSKKNVPERGWRLERPLQVVSRKLPKSLTSFDSKWFGTCSNPKNSWCGHFLRERVGVNFHQQGLHPI